MTLSFDKAFGVHQYTIGVREKRAEVLSENIVNADTPGYKARDIDFSSMLSQAEGTQSGSLSLSKTNDAHLDGGSSLDVGLMYRIPTQPDAGDGNTVDTNYERTEYTRNNIEHQASVEFLNGKITSLLKALKGDGA